MVLTLGPGWAAELERGPDWLFVRLLGEEPFDLVGVDLAERLWQLLQQELCHRLVVELDEVRLVRSHLIGELVLLHKRVHNAGGVIRLCGLSDANYESLRLCRLSDRFPRYHDREAAVMGYRPTKPR